jgi:hypothetical protein
MARSWRDHQQDWTPLERFKVYAYLTLICMLVFLNMCGGILLQPVFYISPWLYRRITTFMLWFSEPGFLCIPFSWERCRVNCNFLGYVKAQEGKNGLFISNHSARVDWYLGMFITNMYCQRVAFVMEYFAMMMPVVGWWRYLVEDMYVVRSFKQDADRLQKNIAGFNECGVTRWCFLSPEGMIADFSDHDKKYIMDCRKFCQEMNHEPYEFLLTPRYKGMTCFNRMVAEDSEASVISVTMAYKQKGKILVKPLLDDDRLIPDLYDLLRGDMVVDVHMHRLTLSNDPEVLKHQMMDEYHVKDKLLKIFYETGRFPHGHPSVTPTPEGWEPSADPELPLSEDYPFQEIGGLWHHHIRMNVSLFSQVLIIYGVSWALNMVSTMLFFVLCFFCTLAIGNLSSICFVGQSRESVPFESLIKGLLFRIGGREGKTKSKKGHTQLAEERDELSAVGRPAADARQRIELASAPGRE